MKKRDLLVVAVDAYRVRKIPPPPPPPPPPKKETKQKIKTNAIIYKNV